MTIVQLDNNIYYFQAKGENEQLRRDVVLLRKQVSRKISFDDDQEDEIGELWKKVTDVLQFSYQIEPLYPFEPKE